MGVSAGRFYRSGVATYLPSLSCPHLLLCCVDDMGRLDGRSSDETAPPCRGKSDSLGLVCVILSSSGCTSCGVESVEMFSGV